MANDIKNLGKDMQQKLKNMIFDTQREIIQATPVNTGRLRQSIAVEEVEDGFIIGTNMDYAPYLEVGTGIYGPYKQPIKPKTKKALAWGKTIGKTDSGAEMKEHVAKEVKGIEPRFMFLKGQQYLEKRIKEAFK